jgi:hypothetical protein
VKIPKQNGTKRALLLTLHITIQSGPLSGNGLVCQSALLY